MNGQRKSSIFSLMVYVDILSVVCNKSANFEPNASVVVQGGAIVSVDNSRQAGVTLKDISPDARAQEQAKAKKKKLCLLR